jgi:hypothetical protein
MAASVPAFPTSLANAGKMPALLEAGASRMPASRSARSAVGLVSDDAIIGLQLDAAGRAAFDRSQVVGLDPPGGKAWMDLEAAPGAPAARAMSAKPVT